MRQRQQRSTRGRTEPLTFSYRAAADYLGVPVETLRSWMKRGLFSRVKIGRRALLLKSEIDRYVLDLHSSGSIDVPAKVMEWADAVCFVNYKTFTTKRDDGKHISVGGQQRTLYTEERPAFLAKNRFNLPAELDFSWKTFINAIKKEGKDK